MFERISRLLQIIQLVADLLLLNAAYFLAGYLRFEDLRVENAEYYNYYVQLLIFLNLSWILLAQVLKIYSLKPGFEIRHAIARLLRLIFIQLAVLTLVVVSLKGYYYSRLFFLLFYSFLVPMAALWRWAFLLRVRRFLQRPENARKVVVVGQGKAAAQFLKEAKNAEFGLNVVATYSGDLKELSGINPATLDTVYCALPGDDVRVAEWYRWCEENLVRFRYVPNWTWRSFSPDSMEHIGELTVLSPRKEPLELWHNRALKRTFDVVFSLLVIVLIFPWFLPVMALWIKLDSRGPVFFVQKRSGLNNIVFSCYKLRTMRPNPEADSRQATQNDPRITRSGRFLRKFSLDELPQFWNILLGQMSVVGPRPHMLAHTEHYRQRIGQFMVRHLIRPGLTGLAQIRGLRGETPNDADMEARIKADVYYLENWSFLLDMKIIGISVLQMFRGGGR